MIFQNTRIKWLGKKKKDKVGRDREREERKGDERRRGGGEERGKKKGK
jgi:hypothetical protein